MGWGFVGDAWDAAKDYGSKAVDKVYENTAKPFVDAGKAGYYAAQGDWENAGGALKDAYSGNIYGQAAIGAYDRGKAIYEGDANGAIKAQYDIQNGVDATNTGQFISPTTEVAQDMRADQLAPPKPGGGGDGAQSAQLARTSVITDGLKAAYDNGNYTSAPVSMVGVPTQLGVAAAPTYLPTTGSATGSAADGYRATMTRGYTDPNAPPNPTGLKAYAPGTTPPSGGGAPQVASPYQDRTSPVGTRIESGVDAFARTVKAPKPVQAAAATAGTTQTEQTADSRGRLVGALQLTQDAANGNAPSAADRGAAIASDKAVARARGLAASVQGRSVGGALQQSQQAGAAAQTEIAAQQMANRANEQAVARGQFLSGTGALREGDTSQAATDATLGTNVNVANAAGANTVSLANAANTLAAGTTNATLGTNVSISNADRDAVTKRAQGDITSREGMAAKELASREATALSQLQLQAQQGNQDAQIRLRTLDEARRSGDRGAYLQALGLETTLVAGIDATNAQKQASNDAFMGALIGAGAQAGAAYYGGGK